jgi:hypothetical protein
MFHDKQAINILGYPTTKREIAGDHVYRWTQEGSPWSALCRYCYRA